MLHSDLIAVPETRDAPTDARIGFLFLFRLLPVILLVTVLPTVTVTEVSISFSGVLVLSFHSFPSFAFLFFSFYLFLLGPSCLTTLCQHSQHPCVEDHCSLTTLPLLEDDRPQTPQPFATGVVADVFGQQ